MPSTPHTASPLVHASFDPITSTASYVVYDRPHGRAAIIDPVLTFDASTGRTSTASVQGLVDFVRDKGLTVDWILETHAHADHVSAAPYLQANLGGRIAIGEHICEVQAIFAERFNLKANGKTGDQAFDHLFSDGETFAIGELLARVHYVPGHTPADLAYQIGDSVFVGDTIFMPDVGTARCDFPGGDAARLYQSIRHLLSLPDSTRLYLCHDYPPSGRSVCWQTTVAEQRQRNIHVHDGIDEASFVAMRTARDKTLNMPVLMLPAIQLNIHAGRLPPAESNGQRYLKLPIDLF